MDGGGSVCCKFTLVNVLVSICLVFFLQRKMKFLFCKEKKTIWEEIESIQAVYPVIGRIQPPEKDEKLFFRLLLT